MDDFGSRVRALLTERGISLRATARALTYDPAYLSRVINGRQRPSEALAAALDGLLEADGALVSLAAPEVHPPESSAERATDVEGDIAHMRASVAHLLAHDNRYGSTAVAPAAVQVWRAEQRKLDRGTVPDRARAGYLSAVAELAEIAGWLLFDSRQWDASRTAFLESHLLARQAGDRAMEWFALDMLAMHDVQTGRAGEALRIADELLTGLRVPPRIALLARVRRGRALAQVGDHRRALNALEGARAGLEESISPRDPAWAWWVNDTEITGHEGEALLAAGEARAAIPTLQRALELASVHFPAGRGTLYYSVALLSAYATTHAWRECEATLVSINTLLETVTSERSRDRLRTTLRVMARQPDAPPALLDLARHTAEAS
ncbi:helix-turn-helix transcriptional regulator [Streptomyces sp. Rer75]|uniref:helix-turn-helix domain-containing protein n=1 Tax=unclassified Streptomyces TaxID=2593676 RepID=UPI0015CFCDF2|nr:helix-turn-helix transcriptional regulator [Streptomyces sp. Rer75]QLH23404.1 helix-turn-helix transcriptional regulator [Streptomyces sp. Rer75]